MKTSLPQGVIDELTKPLARANADFARLYPGESGARQPVHTVYGGAHLFKSDTASRLGAAALASLEQSAPDANTFARAIGIPDPEKLGGVVFERVREKLKREPVEDFRIDFEDGYGNRSDTEEDSHAVSVAAEVALGMSAGKLPPFIGIRVKPFTEELRNRSMRTMDIFLTSVLERSGGKLPDRFVITLPKVVMSRQVDALCDVLDRLESSLSLAAGSLRFELMIETTQSILDADGRSTLPLLLRASRGRCVGAHFGVYDYTASCSITAAHQHMRHSACDFARHMMQVAFAGTGIRLSDGATNVMPIGDAATVHRAWKRHFDDIRHSLTNAYYQGWDLHPAQLPTRYAAVFSFFLEGLDSASDRLRNFVEKAAKATLVGDIFDDAATGQGLLNYFLRAINCGAVTESEAIKLTSLTTAELRSGSFVKILKNRRQI
ncbi:MAG: DUF6986 family protein [Tepidisphaeraceae bacterium]